MAGEGVTFTADRAAVGFAAIIVLSVVSLGAYTLTTPLTSANGHNNVSASTMATSATQSVSTTSSYNYSQYGLMYLSADSGCYAGPSRAGPWSPWFCFGPRSDAIVFNCAAAAATSQGCTQRVYFQGTSNQSYVVTVWYPYLNSEGYTCKVMVADTSLNAYEYCMSLNSTSFVVAQPLPFPPP